MSMYELYQSNHLPVAKLALPPPPLPPVCLCASLYQKPERPALNHVVAKSESSIVELDGD
eukprot:COSAG06_NODE_6283_length_2998_cov_12.037254_3_plen_60_part_00